MPVGAGAGMQFFNMSLEDQLAPPVFLSADEGLQELRNSIRDILVDLSEDENEPCKITEEQVANGLILVPADMEMEPPEEGWTSWRVEATSHSGITTQKHERSKRAKKRSAPDAVGGAPTGHTAGDTDAHMAESPENLESVASTSPRTHTSK